MKLPKRFLTAKTLSTAVLTILTAASRLLSARADIITGLVGYSSLADGGGTSTLNDLSGNGNTGTW